MIDKSKGCEIEIGNIKFFRGLYSTGSLIADVDGEVLYIPAPLRKTYPGKLEDLLYEEIERLKDDKV